MNSSMRRILVDDRTNFFSYNVDSLVIPEESMELVDVDPKGDGCREGGRDDWFPTLKDEHPYFEVKVKFF